VTNLNIENLTESQKQIIDLYKKSKKEKKEKRKLKKLEAKQSMPEDSYMKFVVLLKRQ